MSEPEEEENMSTSTSKTKKRVIEIGRAAKVIRFAIWDVESDHKSIPAEIVGVNVVGFARGANPTPNRLKVDESTRAICLSFFCRVRRNLKGACQY